MPQRSTVVKVAAAGAAAYLFHQLTRIPEGYELSGLDAVWLLMDSDPTNVIVVNGVMTFDTVLTEKEIHDVIVSRFLAQPRFRMRVVTLARGFGANKEAGLLDPSNAGFFVKPEFQACEFDLKNHIFRVSLPCLPPQECLPPNYKIPSEVIESVGRKHSKPQVIFGRPASAIDSDQKLLDYVSILSSIPLPFDRPLWQVHVLENYGGGCAVIFRIHHCIADGVGLMKLLLSLADSNNSQREKKGLDAKAVANTSARRFHKQNASPVIKLFKLLISIVKWPAYIVYALLKLVFMRPDPQTRFRGKLSIAKTAVWSSQIPLTAVKQIASATHGTVNDVVLGIAAGALRKYMQKRGDNVDDTQIRALIPFNLEPLDSRVEMRNDFSLLYLPLPINLNDPKKRIGFINNVMGYLKIGAEPLVNLWTMQICSRVLPLGVLRMFFSYYSQMASIIMTNVPGPTVPLSIQGHEIKQLFAWVPQSGAIGLGISIFSYNGNFRVGFLADDNLVEDAQWIVNEIENEFQQFFIKNDISIDGKAIISNKL